MTFFCSISPHKRSVCDLAIIFFVFFFCSPTFADEKNYLFQIEAQTLSSALIEFSDISNAEYIASTSLIKEIQSNAIAGEMPPSQALTQLLFGTGLNFKKQSDGVYLIFPIQSQNQAVELDKITVTAMKRESLIQETPVAVSSVDGEDMLRQGKTNIRDLFLLSPSVAYHGAVSSAGQGMRIRGFGSGVIASGVDQSVSTIIDGVVTGPSGSGLQELWDTERVEVLRGPQGTLFGKNVSAGAISQITRDPTDYLEFSATSRYEFEYQTQRYDAVVSGPLSDQLNGRLAGFFLDQKKGWVDNPITGLDENTMNRFGVRGKLHYHHADSTAKLNISYDEMDDRCCSRVFSFIDENAASTGTIDNVIPALETYGVVASDNNRTSLSETSLYEQAKTLHAVAEFETKLSSGNTIKSITGVRRWQHKNGRDGDNLPIDMVSYVSDKRDLRIASQEIQLISQGRSKLDYLFGAYFYYQDFPTTEFIGGGADFVGDIGITTVDSTVKVKNMALFTHSTYYLTDPLSVFAGIRILEEEIQAVGQRTGGWFAWPDDYPENKVSKSDLDYTALVGLQYAPDQKSRLYVSLSRGYKGYAIDTSSNSIFFRAPDILDDGSVLSARDALLSPETSLIFETGYKGTYWNDKLLFSAIAFKGEVDNFQASAYDGNSNSFRVTNAGTVETQGLELEFQFQPWIGGTFSGSLAWVDARFKQFSGATCQVAQTAAGTCSTLTSGQDLSGRPVNESPRWQSFVSYYHNHDMKTGTAYFNMSYAWRDEVIFDTDLDLNTKQKAYGLLDARIGFSTYSGVGISVFVNNATNEDYSVRIIDAPVWPGAFQRYPGVLRTYGVEVNYIYE